MLKKSLIIGFAIFGTVLALASSGGGGKKKSLAAQQGFVPLKASHGFTLKSGPNYTGSHVFGSQRNDRFVLYNTLITYQKGNTIFVLPYKYKMNTVKLDGKNNLNAVDVKFKLRK